MTTPYTWVITKDRLFDGKICDRNEVGIAGPRGATDESTALAKKGGVRFKMRDDDGELLYEGRIVGEYDGFEPLDDFGQPNAGATSIEYFNATTGKWEAL